jgi:hypothetical protein
VIDAMDEIARIDTLATDQIIDLASQSSARTVIFAGRSSEWDQGRTAHVKECFGTNPIIVHLTPFNVDEQRQLFVSNFPGEDFEAFAKEAHKFELSPLLGNPEFLKLFGEGYIEGGRVFASKAKIFADAAKRLAYETKRSLLRRRPETSEIVALGGRVFAKLMLSGATGIATVEQLSDCDFPYINSLCHDPRQLGFLIDTHLFKPTHDADKHEPVHRIVAEYCAADYLAKRIKDPRDRLSLARILAVMAPNGSIRGELRGMLGWIAALGDEKLQIAAIRLDPYAVLANGDPSQLTPNAKRKLLAALGDLAERDPMFRRSDRWRRFNIGQFFSPDVLEEVRIILSKPGALRTLVLELLIGTEAALGLMPELTPLMENAAVDTETRMWALEVLLSVPLYTPAADFTGLLAEGSPCSLEIAATAITKRGVSAAGASDVVVLLSRLSGLYPEPDSEHQDRISRYFIATLVRSFNLGDIITFLDALSAELCAPEHKVRCTYRYARSKIIGRLLDRYFELAPAPHDPARIWQWAKSLRFQKQVNGDRSAAVQHLGQDHALRRSVQQLSLSEITGQEAVQEAVTRLYSSHGHSGLNMHQGDRECLSQYASDNGLVDVWTALLCPHVISSHRGPNPTRAGQRTQSRTSRALLAAWSRREKFWRDHTKSTGKPVGSRVRKRQAKRAAAVQQSNRTHLRENLIQIEAGQHWGWLQLFAELYLLEPGELAGVVDDPHTPLRALRNCLQMLQSHIPSVQNLGGGKGTNSAQISLAACLVRYRDGDSLDTIDGPILAAAKTQASFHASFAEGEQERFETVLDAALFRSPDAAEAFVRSYLEAQLAATEHAPNQVYWLDRYAAFQPLRATLPLEWLERFPQTRLEKTRALFRIAASHASHKDLLALIDRRLTDPEGGDDGGPEREKQSRARKAFWQLNAFLYNTPGGETAWEQLKTDPATIFALAEVLGYAHSQGPYERPLATAMQVFKILDAYVDMWPKVPLPNAWGSGDPENETAYRFLCECIWKIKEDTPERQLAVLKRIIADPRFADFHEVALTLRTDAHGQLALRDFRPPHPSEINGLLDKNEVASVEDLRALMVEELGEVQKWIDAAETDPIVSFYSGGKRVDENTARNRIVDQLQGRMKAMGLSVVIERHMSGGNRCDIGTSAMIEGANRLLLTEVKGQWNKELYTAASAQLDERYAIHPDAARQGVYLALWYGNGEKIAKRSDRTITTAAQLKDRIISTMPEELRSRVDVVVLDLSRSLPAPKPKKTTSKEVVSKKPESKTPRSKAARR